MQLHFLYAHKTLFIYLNLADGFINIQCKLTNHDVSVQNQQACWKGRGDRVQQLHHSATNKNTNEAFWSLSHLSFIKLNIKWMILLVNTVSSQSFRLHFLWNVKLIFSSLFTSFVAWKHISVHKKDNGILSFFPHCRFFKNLRVDQSFPPPEALKRKCFSCVLTAWFN